MRDSVIRFFDENQKWLVDVLDQGQEDHTLKITDSTVEIAESSSARSKGRCSSLVRTTTWRSSTPRPGACWPV